MAQVPESHRDLLDAQVATLATIDGDGLPQLTEVWFLHDGDELKFSLNSARSKTKHLQARPGCSALILDLANPYRYIEFRGRARIEEDGDLAFAKKLGEKYGTEFWQHDEP